MSARGDCQTDKTTTKDITGKETSNSRVLHIRQYNRNIINNLKSRNASDKTLTLTCLTEFSGRYEESPSTGGPQRQLIFTIKGTCYHVAKKCHTALL